MSFFRSRKKQAGWRLRLVIDEAPPGRDKYPESNGYDLHNSKPWPLGTYYCESHAIRARNSMVVISDSRSDRIEKAARQLVLLFHDYPFKDLKGEALDKLKALLNT